MAAGYSIYIFALLAAAATPPGNLDPQPGPLVRWPVMAGGNGHYYQSVTAPNGINWADAQKYATAQGGYLATITSEKENNFVFALIDDPKFWHPGLYSKDQMGPWLGGFQPPGSPEPDGGWRWVRAEDAFSYTHWHPLQPDNSYGTEDRLAYYSVGVGTRSSQWNDAGRELR